MKAAKKSKEETADENARPFDPEEAYLLRGKMLGVMLRDARTNAKRSVEDLARLLNTTTAEVYAWEYGDAVPSLPQLELIAYYLDVPVSHFWGLETFESTREDKSSAQNEYVQLRQRMIGAMLRQSRQEADLTIEALAESAHLPVETINQYEMGEIPIPMHELTSLAASVDKNVSYFLETGSQIGELLAIREAWKHFNDLPEDLREFAANPLNIGFIEIALAFSQMPNDKLKRIAVSMLDITGY
jgi:transcriptional regulator with XRE-family HTH domain